MNDALGGFIEAACVPLDSGHASGTLEHAQEILSAHPELADESIHAAAILGNAAAVRRFLDLDAGNATAKGGPHRWDALTHLCFSRYLRLDRARSAGFVDAAEALLEAGASANTGFYSTDHDPPEFESVLYGAAGVAHHPGVTRVLLERGADPNDGEVVYHTPETYDHAVLTLLLDTGKLNADSLATLLLRKHDWHDGDGVKLLLERGADPNRTTRWGFSALHQALRRDNDLQIIELLLDRGADPNLPAHGRPATAMAAREGRGDVLDLFARRGRPIALEGVDRLLAACARDDASQVHALVAREPELAQQISAQAGKLLARVRRRRQYGGREAPARPRRRCRRGRRGGRRVLGDRDEEHRASRRRLARAPLDREAARRARRAGRRAGRPRTHALDACRAGVCRLVLVRPAIA